jgi:hypothetical protein
VDIKKDICENCKNFELCEIEDKNIGNGFNCGLTEEIQQLQSKLDKSIALNEELIDDVEKLSYRYCNAMGCGGRYDEEIRQYQARINKLKGE